MHSRVNRSLLTSFRQEKQVLKQVYTKKYKSADVQPLFEIVMQLFFPICPQALRDQPIPLGLFFRDGVRGKGVLTWGKPGKPSSKQN